jgi:hypothetical protein
MKHIKLFEELHPDSLYQLGQDYLKNNPAQDDAQDDMASSPEVKNAVVAKIMEAIKDNGHEGFFLKSDFYKERIKERINAELEGFAKMVRREYKS